MTINEGNRPRIKTNAVRVTPTQHERPKIQKTEEDIYWDNKKKGINALIKDKKREIRKLEKAEAKRNGLISKYDKSGTLEATGEYSIIKRKFFPDNKPVVRIKNYDNVQDAKKNMDVMTDSILNRGHLAWCEITSVAGKNRIKSFTAINPTNGNIIDIFIQDNNNPSTTSIVDIFKEIRRNIADIKDHDALPILNKYWPEALKDGRIDVENSLDRIYDENPLGRIAWYKDEKATAHVMRENNIPLNLNDIKTIVSECVNNIIKGLV